MFNEYTNGFAAMCVIYKYSQVWYIWYTVILKCVVCDIQWRSSVLHATHKDFQVCRMWHAMIFRCVACDMSRFSGVMHMTYQVFQVCECMCACMCTCVCVCVRVFSPVCIRLQFVLYVFATVRVCVNFLSFHLCFCFWIDEPSNEIHCKGVRRNQTAVTAQEVRIWTNIAFTHFKLFLTLSPVEKIFKPIFST